MQNDDVVLSVRNVSKCFEMYEKPVHRLYQTLCAGHKKFYKEFWALKDISFDVHRGECVGIIGRNGAGKSTLLQIITGTLAPTSGTVETHGRIAALLELGSGFNPEFTGRENVYLNGAILGLSREEIDARYDDILAFADIGDFINQPVKTYSSGMMVRLAFAVIAHVDAQVLIIDEALSVGDAFFQQKCMRFLREFIKTHTVMFVSHDTSAVTSFCNRAVMLDKGALKMAGEPKEVVQQYMKEYFAELQGVDSLSTPTATIPDAHKNRPIVYRDMRSDYINNSNARNDIEIFKFDKESPSFGEGGAYIESVTLCDEADQPLSWLIGGEIAVLKITCRARKALHSPIIGFIVRDHLGQNLFGDNTYISYRETPIDVLPNEQYQAMFEFRMPYLTPGDYSVCVGVAEGTQENHVQHQWMDEALIFKSHSNHPVGGIFGLPMHKITLTHG